MSELKTVNDLVGNAQAPYPREWCLRNELKQEAIKWIKNLQSSETKYPIILDALPEGMKGECAKDKRYETDFRYGSEYGMISWIKYFFNITEEDLK